MPHTRQLQMAAQKNKQNNPHGYQEKSREEENLVYACKYSHTVHSFCEISFAIENYYGINYSKSFQFLLCNLLLNLQFQINYVAIRKSGSMRMAIVVNVNYHVRKIVLL